MHGHAWILTTHLVATVVVFHGKLCIRLKKIDSTYLGFTAEKRKTRLDYVDVFELRVHDLCGFHGMCRFQGRNMV